MKLSRARRREQVLSVVKSARNQIRSFPAHDEPTFVICFGLPGSCRLGVGCRRSSICGRVAPRQRLESWPAIRSSKRSGERRMVGWPGFEPGTNPESLRGCSIATGAATRPVPIAGSCCVSSLVPRSGLRSTRPFPLPLQILNSHPIAWSNVYDRVGVLERRRSRSVVEPMQCRPESPRRM